MTIVLSSKTTAFVEESQGHSFRDASTRKGGAELIKGIASFFACSYYQFFCYKI
jgi:hypothetical protein